MVKLYETFESYYKGLNENELNTDSVDQTLDELLKLENIPNILSIYDAINFYGFYSSFWNAQVRMDNGLDVKYNYEDDSSSNLNKKRVELSEILDFKNFKNIEDYIKHAKNIIKSFSSFLKNDVSIMYFLSNEFKVDTKYYKDAKRYNQVTKLKKEWDKIKVKK